MKSKDKSSEQRFGHMNATNRNIPTYLNIIFIKLAKQWMKTKKLKFGLLRFLVLKTFKKLGF